jgi:antitoxin component YwqK of YwqJK toxin-antitoxin module
MAMAFMARQERFLNKLVSVALFVTACTPKPVVAEMEAVVPPVYIQSADTSLHQGPGYLLHGNEKFSGVVYTLFSNGDTAQIAGYLDGKEEGRSRRWYVGRRVQEDRYFRAGHKEGWHRGWWENGKPRFMYHFDNDEYSGVVEEWSETGIVSKRFHYRAGHEEGLQQLWWADGSLRANYIVRGGEQYGLIGRKLCVNADTSKIK